MTARTSVAATAAAALLAAGCSTPEHGAGHPPAATSPAPTLSPGVPDSAELSEPVVARGRVLRADGTGVADALVTLESTSSSGEPSHPVAVTRSGVDGSYELRIPAELRDALLTNDDGLVEFAVAAESPDGNARSDPWTAPAEPTHPQTIDLEVP
ncbi:hypothetical protein [Jiangella mangrovi]|uniref:Carboxypeptidase regulatory-like domain-containing protein n=1 Tax=Jiangella mangrovi TaxID=1524084 RepID=A0A7W9GUT5_9ACTN|nr:hypothetical protein [Jiangella mangrovi]MBB5790056.1 hypothetical protein [Jiangella mangrovi]